MIVNHYSFSYLDFELEIDCPGSYDLEWYFEYRCRECGWRVILHKDGTTNHIDEDGEVEYNLDGHHVAIPEIQGL